MYLWVINKYTFIFKWYAQILFYISEVLNILRCLDTEAANLYLQITGACSAL